MPSLEQGRQSPSRATRSGTAPPRHSSRLLGLLSRSLGTLGVGTPKLACDTVAPVGWLHCSPVRLNAEVDEPRLGPARSPWFLAESHDAPPRLEGCSASWERFETGVTMKSSYHWSGGLVILAVLLLAQVASAGPTKVRKPVDWVGLNPKFAGATFVKDAETCRPCHENYMKTYALTRHAQVFAGAPPADMGDCESCHGPRSQHIENRPQSCESTPLPRPSRPSACSVMRVDPGWAGRPVRITRPTSAAPRVIT
jgi:hypothetical protein